MKRAPDWTPDEFEILLQNSSLSPKDLSPRLPGRTPDAIEVVRNGVHDFHTKGDSTLLSKMMKQCLSKPGSSLACPICGESLDVPAR